MTEPTAIYTSTIADIRRCHMREEAARLSQSEDALRGIVRDTWLAVAGFDDMNDGEQRAALAQARNLRLMLEAVLEAGEGE